MASVVSGPPDQRYASGGVGTPFCNPGWGVSVIQNIEDLYLGDSAALVWGGAWHRVRDHLRFPDPGQPNGIFKTWVDSVQVMDRTGFTLPVPTNSPGGFIGLTLSANMNQNLIELLALLSV